MKIADLDKNFASSKINEKDIVFINAKDSKFSLHGGFYDYDDGIYRRVPKDVAINTSETVKEISKNTSGLRIRFSTNSPYVAIRAYLTEHWKFSHLSITGHSCFGLTVNGIVYKPFITDYDEISTLVNGIYKTEKIIYLENDNKKDIEIQFPLYNSVLD